MILFLDPQKQTLKLYSDQGIEDFEFDEVDDLAKRLGKNKVMYVLNAMEATGQQIVDTVNETIRINGNQSNDPLDQMDSQTYYLQSLNVGVLHIKDINVTFEGKGDCKLIDEEMAELLQESMVLRQLIKKGMVRIVDYAEMKKSSRKQMKHKMKNQKAIQAARDKDLDSIIVKTDRPGSAEMLASGMFSGDDDVVKTTDITDSIMNDPTDSMSPEQLDVLIREGKLAP